MKLSEDERIAVESFIDDMYQKLDEVTGLQFLNNEGSALYVTQSKINHSCVPNSVITFPSSDHTLSLIALSDIKAGDEITISYLDECSVDRSRHSRQKVKDIQEKTFDFLHRSFSGTHGKLSFRLSLH